MPFVLVTIDPETNKKSCKNNVRDICTISRKNTIYNMTHVAS